MRRAARTPILGAVGLAVLTLLVGPPAQAAALWSADKGEVAIDHGLLDDLLAGKAASFEIAIDGKPAVVEVQEVLPVNLGVARLRGRLQGRPGSYFLLCRGGDQATVAVFGDGEKAAYKLGYSEGRPVVTATKDMKHGDCGGAIAPGDLEPRTVPLAHPVLRPDAVKEAGTADDGTRHDVFVVYTFNAILPVGTQSILEAEIQLAVDQANLAYDLSGITSDLRLVHTAMVDYDEFLSLPSSYEDHVYRLQDPDDGWLDEVLIRRDRVGADFVCMVIDGTDLFSGEVEYAGMAAVMGPGMNVPEMGEWAMSVVSAQFITSDWAFVHEIGHNRGCAHDRDNAEHDGVFSYSYGSRFYLDEVAETGYRTIMAYPHFYFDYERVPRFSNPDATYFGHPTGVAVGLPGEAHNALTHEQTSALCATFRAEHTFVDFDATEPPDGSFDYPYASIAAAIAGSRTDGYLSLRGSDAGFTGVMSTPRAYRHDGEGSTVLGGN